MTDTTGRKRRQFFCNDCERQTWHEELWQTRRHFDGTDYPNWSVDYADQWLEVWECQGCEDVFFLKAWATDEDSERTEDIYPERSAHHVKPKAFVNMSDVLADMYEESIRTFNARCPLLCAGGLRALLEGICNDKGARGSNLENKINGLAEWVPPNVLANLHGFRFLGNRALHDLEVPADKDLALAIEVMEDVMNAIYELDYKSGRLLQQVNKQPVLEGPLSDRKKAYQKFFVDFLTLLKERNPGFTTASPDRVRYDNWLSIAAGRAGFVFQPEFMRNPDRFVIQLNITTGSRDRNKLAFDQLFEAKDEIERAFGRPLEWRRLDEKKECRIGMSFARGVEAPPDRLEQVKAEAVESLIRLGEILRPRVRALNLERPVNEGFS